MFFEMDNKWDRVYWDHGVPRKTDTMTHDEVRVRGPLPGRELGEDFGRERRHHVPADWNGTMLCKAEIQLYIAM